MFSTCLRDEGIPFEQSALNITIRAIQNALSLTEAINVLVVPWTASRGCCLRSHDITTTGEHLYQQCKILLQGDLWTDD